MQPYALVPLGAAMAAAACAAALWVREPHRRVLRPAVAILACACFWSICEVAWSLADDADAALRWARLAGLGVLWIGPLSIQLHAALDRQAVPGPLLRALPVLYLATPVLILAYLVWPGFLSGAARGPWGWQPLFGPAFPLPALWVVGYPVAVALEALAGRWRAPLARRGLRPLMAAFVVLLATAVLTEVALPLAGISSPPLGAAALALLAVAVLVSLYQLGHRVVGSQSMARELLDAFPDGVALLRRDGRIRSANQNLARLVGMERAALRGVALETLLDAPLPEAGSAAEVQATLRAADGRGLPVSVTASTIRARDGASVGRVVAVRDQRPALELRGRLVATGRLAAVGELAAAITHEINNPLAFVRTNLQALAELLDELAKATSALPGCASLPAIAAESHSLVAGTLEGAGRVAEIVQDVRSFSGAGHQEHEDASLNQLCDEALRVSLHSIPARVAVVRDYGSLPPVPCAPRELVQVFLNLLSNAAHAVEERGTIRIATCVEDGRAVVRVADDGPGIPDDVIERIFDPFFTTKPVGEGTGLGLAISRQIIESHGGELAVERPQGGGTVLRVGLPLRPAGEREDPAPPRDEPGAAPSGEGG